QDLEPARMGAGHTDRVLVGLRAAVREKHMVEVAGSQIGDETGGFAAGVSGKRGLDGGQSRCLALDRRDEFRMLVPDIDIDELAGKIKVARAVHVREMDA